MISIFNPLFDYNFYCNKKLIDQFNDIEISLTEKHLTLMSHILNVHHIWNSRILGMEECYKVFQMLSIHELEDIHYQNQRSTFEIITNTDNFDQRIDYVNSEGKHYTNSIHDILFHIINHSTHHRGQLALVSGQHGIEPLALDYIAYKR
jgi:uncharacterized damage-inducible protein DinB